MVYDLNLSMSCVFAEMLHNNNIVMGSCSKNNSNTKSGFLGVKGLFPKPHPNTKCWKYMKILEVPISNDGKNQSQ